MQLNAAVQEIRARQVFAGRAHLMPINALAFPLQLPPHSFTAPPSLSPSSVPSLSLSIWTSVLLFILLVSKFWRIGFKKLAKVSQIDTRKTKLFKSNRNCFV
jgi:hypothetical protein